MFSSDHRMWCVSIRQGKLIYLSRGKVGSHRWVQLPFPHLNTYYRKIERKPTYLRSNMTCFEKWPASLNWPVTSLAFTYVFFCTNSEIFRRGLRTSSMKMFCLTHSRKKVWERKSLSVSLGSVIPPALSTQSREDVKAFSHFQHHLSWVLFQLCAKSSLLNVHNSFICDSSVVECKVQEESYKSRSLSTLQHKLKICCRVSQSYLSLWVIAIGFK